MPENYNDAAQGEQVFHPNHYNQGNIEVIDVIEGLGLGFHEGTIVKYVARARYKNNMIQDLEKARWYLNRLIAVTKREVGLPLTEEEVKLFRTYVP